MRILSTITPIVLASMVSLSANAQSLADVNITLPLDVLLDLDPTGALSVEGDLNGFDAIAFDNVLNESATAVLTDSVAPPSSLIETDVINDFGTFSLADLGDFQSIQLLADLNESASDFEIGPDSLSISLPGDELGVNLNDILLDLGASQF